MLLWSCEPQPMKRIPPSTIEECIKYISLLGKRHDQEIKVRLADDRES